MDHAQEMKRMGEAARNLVREEEEEEGGGKKDATVVSQSCKGAGRGTKYPQPGSGFNSPQGALALYSEVQPHVCQCNGTPGAPLRCTRHCDEGKNAKKREGKRKRRGKERKVSGRLLGARLGLEVCSNASNTALNLAQYKRMVRTK